jgi:hypothetical protein
MNQFTQHASKVLFTYLSHLPLTSTILLALFVILDVTDSDPELKSSLVRVK